MMALPLAGGVGSLRRLSEGLPMGWGVLLGVVLLSGGSGGLQRWAHQPPYTEANPGEEVLMPCIVQNIQGRCHWMKDGAPVGFFEGKYELAGKTEEGDCSLRIRDLDSAYDQGHWQCSVTASDFRTKDALVSDAAELVVRTPPSSLSLSPGESGKIEVLENTNVTLVCRAEGGRPPAKVTWHIPESLSTFALSHTSTDSSSASSVVALAQRADRGTEISCSASHPALSAPLVAHATLDVLYVPIVSVSYRLPGTREGVRGSRIALAEGDAVTLICRPDSNPPGGVAWRRTGGQGVWSTEQEVLISPAGRESAGIYTCTAHNKLGVSGPREIQLDVEYSPHITGVEPSGEVQAPVGGTAEITCHAQAHPSPGYRWLQRRGERLVVRGNQRTLRLSHLGFEDSGQFVCAAHNLVRGEERITQAEPVTLRITGPPRLDLEPGTRFEALSGSEAVLEVTLCGEPRPEVRWSLGSLLLTAGTEHSRFRASPLTPLPSHRHCYISRLLLGQAAAQDSAHYQVTAENRLGSETHSLELVVHEGRQMEVFIAVSVGGVLTILTLSLIIVYVLVTRDRCCQNFLHCGDREQKADQSELGSDRTDLGSPDSTALVAGPPDPCHGSAVPTLLYSNPSHKEASFHTFRRHREGDPGIPCGAYSVTGASMSRLQGGGRVDTRFQAPELANVSYYRYA